MKDGLFSFLISDTHYLLLGNVGKRKFAEYGTFKILDVGCINNFAPLCDIDVKSNIIMFANFETCIICITCLIKRV